MNNLDSFLNKSNKALFENNQKKQCIINSIYKNTSIQLEPKDIILTDTKIKISVLGIKKNVILKNKDCILREIQSLYDFNQLV